MSNSSQNHIAVLGCGYWGKNLVRNFAELGALKVVCDTDSTLLDKFQKQYQVEGTIDFTSVLERPDIQAVVIATPASTHADLVMQSLASGKDVFVEKPLALSLTDAIEIRAAAQRYDRLVMVGHLLEYHPVMVQVRNLASGGQIGRLRYLYSNRLSFGKVRSEENVLWSFAPHDICAILRLVGQLPTSVRATGRACLSQVEDFCMIQLEFEQNIQAHIFVSWLHPFKEQRLVVVGDEGAIVFDDVSTDEKLALYQQQIEFQNSVPLLKQNTKTIIPTQSAEPLRLECQHFLDCIANRQTPLTDVQNGIDVLTVLQAAQFSLESNGKAVILEEYNLVSR